MLTAITSIAALIVAILSAVAAWRVSRRQAHVQERLLSLESRRERDRITSNARARVSGAIIREGSSDWSLAITNEGPSQAREVVVLLNGAAVGESDDIIGTDKPVRLLGPGASVRYRLLVYMGSADHFRVDISWEDDSGEPGSWSSELLL
jgi:hypothetical protein